MAKIEGFSIRNYGVLKDITLMSSRNVFVNAAKEKRAADLRYDSSALFRRRALNERNVDTGKKTGRLFANPKGQRRPGR